MDRAVATPHHLATDAGRDVLANGGSAMDAAIAANAMLGVVYPHMCGLGGDLFLLYFEATTGTVHCLNGTGPAPTLATVEAFAERGLAEVPARGPLTVTVPGTVGAWEAARGRFGALALGDLLAPAIAAAEDGAAITDRIAGWIGESAADLAADPALRDLYLEPDGRTPRRAGDRVRQPALAASLRRLATAGAADFYAGEIAAEIDRAMRARGGLLRRADLAAYAPDWVAPVHARHAGLELVTTPANSQGVTALLMLGHMAAAGDPAPGTPAYLAAFVAAKRHAFRLRDAHVTDAAHMTVGAAELLAQVAPVRAGEPPAPPPGGDTIYLCTRDAEGNACSLIQSLYYGFGACCVAGDTGILLHNRGHYFSLDPDSVNVLAPDKRTLHTLMATMALEDGRPRFVLGAMGADGQPQFNVQVLHRLLAGASPAEAVAAPRVLHGRFALEDDPDTLHVEADYDAAAPAGLGCELEVVPSRSERMGHAHAIAIDAGGVVRAGADPRSDGSAVVL